MKPVFSIIVPVYNVGKWLDACLESIRIQKGNWECILVDDGSSDGSGEKCDRLALEDSRFRVIYQKNSGVSAARNRGLEAARGEWVWFIDADDVIHPEALVYLEQKLKQATADFIYFDYLHGEEISFSKVIIPEDLEIKEKEDCIPEMSQWRCVFHRKISENIRFEDYIVGEDFLFCAKLSAQAGRLGYLPVQLYGYVKRNSSVMHSVSFRKTQDSILWQRQVLQFYNNCKLYKHLERSRWNKFFFGTASKIVRHSKDEQKKLVDIWYHEITESSKMKASPIINVLRKIYLLEKYIPGMKLFGIRLNSLIFSSYMKARKLLK